jgi:hypothetical protein
MIMNEKCMICFAVKDCVVGICKDCSAGKTIEVPKYWLESLAKLGDLAVNEMEALKLESFYIKTLIEFADSAQTIIKLKSKLNKS